MYLPDIYKQFSSRFPEILDAFKKLGTACRDAGPLDRKTQDLVKFGIAVGVNSRGAIMSAARKSMESGASKEEIEQVVLLSLTTTGFPNMMAAMDLVNAVHREQQPKV